MTRRPPLSLPAAGPEGDPDVGHHQLGRVLRLLQQLSHGAHPGPGLPRGAVLPGGRATHDRVGYSIGHSSGTTRHDANWSRVLIRLLFINMSFERLAFRMLHQAALVCCIKLF